MGTYAHIYIYTYTYTYVYLSVHVCKFVCVPVYTLYIYCTCTFMLAALAGLLARALRARLQIVTWGRGPGSTILKKVSPPEILR